MVYAGAYYLTGNETFYLNSNDFIWTMTPTGVNKNTSQAYTWQLRTEGLVLYFDVAGGQTN